MGVQVTNTSLQPEALGAMDGILVTMLLAVGTEKLSLLISKVITKLGKAKAKPFLIALNTAIEDAAKNQKIKL